MEIAYIKASFGDFYYNRKTYEGVVVHPPNSRLPCVVIRMKETYDPSWFPPVVKLQVEEKAFQNLCNAANKEDSVLVNKIIAEEFRNHEI